MFVHFKHAVACLGLNVGRELDNNEFGLKGNSTKVRFYSLMSSLMVFAQCRFVPTLSAWEWRTAFWETVNGPINRQIHMHSITCLLSNEI